MPSLELCKLPVGRTFHFTSRTILTFDSYYYHNQTTPRSFTGRALTVRSVRQSERAVYDQLRSTDFEARFHSLVTRLLGYYAVNVTISSSHKPFVKP